MNGVFSSSVETCGALQVVLCAFLPFSVKRYTFTSWIHLIFTIQKVWMLALLRFCCCFWNKSLMLTKVAFIWQNTVEHEILLKCKQLVSSLNNLTCNLFLWCKAVFSASLQRHMIFRNQYNMQIWCLRNMYYYQCWKPLCCFIFLRNSEQKVRKNGFCLKIEILCNIKNFTVTFDQLNASLMNKSVHLFYKSTPNLWTEVYVQYC